MGMHRDGTRWNLEQDVVEERRKVFWECNAADIFQAHCFSRPYVISARAYSRAEINQECNESRALRYCLSLGAAKPQGRKELF
jgi:hypothetical protein